MSGVHKSATAVGGARLDEWACVYPGPTAVPFEQKLTGAVFRGMQDEAKAKSYAQDVGAFFASLGVSKPVFVVKGPTSTTKCKFEVVDASCGYTTVCVVAPKVAST